MMNTRTTGGMARKVDMGRLLCQSLTMPSKQSGLFSSMPRRDRAVVAGAAFLFMMGQIIGALLNRFGYAWLWWL